jgi:ferredoxin-NADP reductase
MPAATTTRRLLRSPLVDLLVGPHGIDRYLELIRPNLTVRDARAEVIAVRHQTARSVTLKLRPNAAWSGFRAGQFVRVGVEIGGVRRSRTYSPVDSEHCADGTLELTATVQPQGLVSRHLQGRVRTGQIVHLDPAQGEFVLPDVRPERLVLLSGGSGITPVLSMLQTLCDEGHRGEIVFLHYARTEADWLYHSEVQALAAAHGNVRPTYVATREDGRHIDAAAIRALLGGRGPEAAHVAVCGPPSLIDATGEIWSGASDQVLAETFTPAPLNLEGGATDGTLSFLRSQQTAAIGEGTLLQQAEAAGLAPEFGCRMGICHTCTCRKTAGAVRNVLTGEVSEEEDEDIQLCISVPAGDVALQI